MNQHVKNLYVVIDDNEVIHAATSLTDFYRFVKGIISGVKSMSYYQKRFVDTNMIEHIDFIGKVYYFQKVK